MSTQSNVSNLVSLDGAHTDRQLMDENYCRDMLSVAANYGLIHVDHKAKADDAGNSLARGMWLATQGYFLRVGVPPDAAADIAAWKIWVSSEDPVKGNHAAKLVRYFDKVAADLLRTQPNKFSREFFEGDKSTRGQSSPWKTRVSQIKTAIEDGVNPIAKDRNQQYLCCSIDDARKERTRIKEAKAKADAALVIQHEQTDALRTPEGKKLAIAAAVGKSITTMLSNAADVDEVLFILKQTNPIEHIGNTFNSQRKASFSNSAYDNLRDAFEREIGKIKAFNADKEDSARRELAATQATVTTMSRELKDVPEQQGNVIAELQEPIDTGMTPVEAYDYGKQCFTDGIRFEAADKPDFASQNYVMFVRGYREAAIAWINHPANTSQIGTDRGDEVMADIAASGAMLKSK